MEQFLDAILRVDPLVVYLIVGLLAFGEAAAFIGLVLPGETVVVLGGVMAAEGRVSLPVLLVVVAVTAVAGDSAGYEIGRRWGTRLMRLRMLRRYQPTIAKAAVAMGRWGGPIVFIGRWTGALRACVPALAGMSRMPYRRFMVFNVLGGVSWSVVFTLLGYYAAESFHLIEEATGRASLAFGALVVSALIVKAALGRRQRRLQDAEAHPVAADLPMMRGGSGEGNGPSVVSVAEPEPVATRERQSCR